MGPELGPVFHALYYELSILHIRWNQYVELFGTKPERIELLNDTAGHFFRVVQDNLWEGTLLHLSRITDRPNSAGRPNLTIQRLPELLSGQSLTGLSEEVQTLVDEAVSKTSFARDWRNRHIAHTDLARALETDTTPLAPASRACVKESLRAIDAILNRLEHHFKKITVRYEGFGSSGDAKSLLYVLRDGLEAEKRRHERLRDGRPLGDD